MAFHGDAQSKGRAVALANIRATELQRFAAKIDIPKGLFDCWIWTGSKLPTGYGHLTWRGRTQRAHVVALGLVDGDWANRLDVCHACDVRLCVNPLHLWRGTRRENMQDAKAKGRLVKKQGY